MSDQRVMLATEAVLRGNGHRALEHLAQVEDFEDERVWLVRAHALSLIGEHQLAEDACRRGITLDAGNTALRIELARALTAQSKRPEAETVLISVLNQSPENLEALIAYASLLAQSGDVDGARQVMQHVPTHLSDQMPSLLALQAHLALIEGRHDQARLLIDRALHMAPEMASVRMLAACEAALRGRSSTAATQMSAAARLDPEQASAHGRMARYMAHPLMAPSRLVERVGPAQLWIVWVVVLFGLPRLWPGAPMGWIVVLYLIFAAWTWIVPRLLRRWLIRRGQL